jgi:hypothetical protein
MIRAVNNQINHANKILYNYGNDSSGLIEYKFNSLGFRSCSEFNYIPDFLIFGGSANFGIGVDFNLCYWSIIAKTVGYKFWNCSYASFAYTNKIIYNTILTTPPEFYNTPIVVQWVGHGYDTTDNIFPHEYAQLVKQKFPRVINLLIDGDQEKTEAITANFDLINPPCLDTDSSGSHPGVKTHYYLAKWFLKKYFNND